MLDIKKTTVKYDVLRAVSLITSVIVFAVVNDWDSPRWDWPGTLNTYVMPARRVIHYTYAVPMSGILMAIVTLDLVAVLFEQCMPRNKSKIQLFRDATVLPMCTATFCVLIGIHDGAALFFASGLQLLQVLSERQTPDTITFMSTWLAIFVPVAVAAQAMQSFSLAGHNMPTHITMAFITYLFLGKHTYSKRFYDYSTIYTMWACYGITMFDDTAPVMYCAIAIIVVIILSWVATGFR